MVLKAIRRLEWVGEFSREFENDWCLLDGRKVLSLWVLIRVFSILDWLPEFVFSPFLYNPCSPRHELMPGSHMLEISVFIMRSSFLAIRFIVGLILGVSFELCSNL